MELLQWPLLMHLVSLRPSQVTKKQQKEEKPVIIANNGNNAKPLFTSMIDPLLEGKHPLKGLYQGKGVNYYSFPDNLNLLQMEDTHTSLVISSVINKSAVKVQILSLFLQKDLSRYQKLKRVAEVSSEVGIFPRLLGN
ncbi:hypothetical protein QYF36_005332 [Acer negundo]|nr:hypothetical protein QYF36_005332 [Acer negundo]